MRVPRLLSFSLLLGLVLAIALNGDGGPATDLPATA
jgi:hypothetical protein